MQMGRQQTPLQLPLQAALSTTLHEEEHLQSGHWSKFLLNL